jgi:calcium/calmodulin-dependent protein kinase I
MGNFVAIKEIDTQQLSVAQIRGIHYELNILSQLQDNEHFLKMHCVYVKGVSIFLIVEYLGGGELFDAISMLDTYSEDHVRWIMYQLVSAVKYMHSRKVIHRDLKPEVIMVKSVNIKDYRNISVRIIDVGIAMIEGKGSSRPQNLLFGSPGCVHLTNL